MSKIPTVMFDLTQAVFPTSGIPQEARLMYKMLAKSDSINLSGIVLKPVNWPWRFSNNKNIDTAKFIYELATNPRIGNASKPDMKNPINFVKEIFNQGIFILKSFFHVCGLIRKPQFSCHTVKDNDLKNGLWSILFSNTLSGSFKSKILTTSFYLSDYNPNAFAFSRIGRRTYLTLPESPDFLVIHGYKKVNLKDKSTQIIHRYVDNIALESPHTLKDSGTLYIVKSVLESFDENSKIVVISDHVKKGLLRLNTQVRSENVFTIYPNIVAYKKNQVSKEHLKSVIDNCLSSFHQTHAKTNIVQEDIPYILAISTIEPRKNYTNLIKAWALYNKNTKNPVKLIIVGRFGWNCSTEKKLAEVYIKTGELIHLENVDREDLEILLSHAKMLPFLSFNEGFGAPPLEAMQCECPTLVADIDVFHEVYEDAALFCDPYDIHDIAAKMSLLLNDSKESKNLRTSLIEKGLKNVKRFSDETLLNKWMEMFEILSAKK